ncbi:MAG: DnaB-like helicase C-terminal domain-containing protein [Kofleriaceae bacterium]
MYVTIELDEVEAASRMAGQACGGSWEDVMRGRVDRWRMEDAIELPRLFMLEGERATLDNIAPTVAAARMEFPGEPVLVVVDYLQILGDGTVADSERTRIATVIERLRRLAKDLGVVVLDLSQTSRAAAKSLRDGDLVGADTPQPRGRSPRRSSAPAT